MMSPLEVAYQLLIMLVVPLLLLYLASRSASHRRPSNEDGSNAQKLPPSPPALPIIGHLCDVMQNETYCN